MSDILDDDLPSESVSTVIEKAGTVSESETMANMKDIQNEVVSPTETKLAVVGPEIKLPVIDQVPEIQPIQVAETVKKELAIVEMDPAVEIESKSEDITVEPVRFVLEENVTIDSTAVEEISSEAIIPTKFEEETVAISEDIEKIE